MSTVAKYRCLGIDVGTATTGWAILDVYTRGYKLVGYGVITTKSTSPMPERLAELYSGMSEIISLYSPNHIAIESLFFFKNQKTVMSVSQARGVIILAAQHSALQISEYTPLQVKSAVTGYGRADKLQLQQMVKTILNLRELPKPDDAADAIGIAICHAHTNKDFEQIV